MFTIFEVSIFCVLLKYEHEPPNYQTWVSY